MTSTSNNTNAIPSVFQDNAVSKVSDTAQVTSRIVYGLNEAKYRNSSRDKQLDHDSLIDHLDLRIILSPNDPYLHYNRGIGLFEVGRFADAVKSFTRAAELLPGFASALNNRGLIFAMTDRHQEALRDYNEAIVMDPTLVEARFGRAAALAHLGRFEEAYTSFSDCIRMGTGRHDLPDIYVERARTLLALKRPAEAMLDADTAIILRPEPQSYLLKASILAAQKNYPAAIDNLNKAISLDANFAPAYLFRSEVYRYVDDQKWIEDRRVAFSLDPSLEWRMTSKG